LIEIRLNGKYNQVRIGQHLSDNFPIEKSLKLGDVLKPSFFDFALEYDIRNVRENQVELKQKGPRRLLIYTNDVNLLGDNILVGTIKKRTETLFHANMEVSMEVNTDKTKYMLLSPHQNAGQLS
jgi:hypothetical protein